MLSFNFSVQCRKTAFVRDYFPSPDSNAWRPALLYACFVFILWLLKCFHVCSNNCVWVWERSGKYYPGHLPTVSLSQNANQKKQLLQTNWEHSGLVTVLWELFSPFWIQSKVLMNYVCAFGGTFSSSLRLQPCLLLFRKVLRTMCLLLLLLISVQ